MCAFFLAARLNWRVYANQYNRLFINYLWRSIDSMIGILATGFRRQSDSDCVVVSAEWMNGTNWNFSCILHNQRVTQRFQSNATSGLLTMYVCSRGDSVGQKMNGMETFRSSYHHREYRRWSYHWDCRVISALIVNKNRCWKYYWLLDWDLFNTVRFLAFPFIQQQLFQ